MKSPQLALTICLLAFACPACFTTSHAVEHATTSADPISVLQGPISVPHETLADVIVETNCNTLLPLTAAPRSGAAVLNVVDPTDAERAAIEALRDKARSLGADALIHTRVSYDTYLRLPPIVSLIDFCLMTASGTAVRFVDFNRTAPISLKSL